MRFSLGPDLIMTHVPRSLRTVTEKELGEEGDSIERGDIFPKIENISKIHQTKGDAQNVSLAIDAGTSEKTRKSRKKHNFRFS